MFTVNVPPSYGVSFYNENGHRACYREQTVSKEKVPSGSV